MNERQLVELLNQYKETKRCLELGIDLVDRKEYARGKLDVVNMMIDDLERMLMN